MQGIGAEEKRIAEQHLFLGQPIPESIENAPQLHLGSAIFLRAFYDLHACRNGLAPIPWTAIHEYASAYELDNECREAIFIHVKALDNEFLKREEKRIASKSK